MATETKKSAKFLYATFEQIPSPSGATCWIWEEIKHLGTYFEIDVLSVKADQLSHIERYCGARLLRVPVGTGSFPSKIKAFQRALNRQLDSEDYQLCHFNTIWEGIVLAERRQTSGFKLIYEPFSLPSVDYKFLHPDDSAQADKYWSFAQGEARCFSIADRIVVGSAFLREHIIRRGVSAKRIAVITPGIDLAPFERTANTLGQPRTILYLGSLMPWQGVNSLLMAISQLPRQMPVRLSLVVPKEEPWIRELLGKIQILGLHKTVEVVEPVPIENLPELVAKSSLCIAPLSNHEHNRVAAPIPHKVLVYMAARRPVIVADQPAVRGLVEHGVHGLVFPPGDTREMAEAIRRLLMDRELGQEMGKRGRLHLEESFSLDGAIGQLFDVYSELLGQPIAFSGSRKAGEVTLPEFSTSDLSHPPVAPNAPAQKKSLGAPDDTAPMLVAPAPAPAPAPKLAPTQLQQVPSSETGSSEPGSGEGAPIQPPAPDELFAVSKEVEPEELVFQPLDAVDTMPEAVFQDPDSWQVLKLSQVQLPPGKAVKPEPPTPFEPEDAPLLIECDFQEIQPPPDSPPGQPEGAPVPASAATDVPPADENELKKIRKSEVTPICPPPAPVPKRPPRT